MPDFVWYKCPRCGTCVDPGVWTIEAAIKVHTKRCSLSAVVPRGSA